MAHQSLPYYIRWQEETQVFEACIGDTVKATFASDKLQDADEYVTAFNLLYLHKQKIKNEATLLMSLMKSFQG